MLPLRNACRTAAEDLLLQLPDPCLLVVLQFCAANDQRSLFSAARSHSRLHQAAVMAMCSITAVLHNQQQADALLLYMSRHGQHVGSVVCRGQNRNGQYMDHIEPNLRLQLHWGLGLQGVLGLAAGGTALKKLHVHDCAILDGPDGWTAAVSQLPAGLEHLSLKGLGSIHQLGLPSAMFQRLQQLTCLDLRQLRWRAPMRPGQPFKICSPST
jgi:hypothetical protein